MGYNPYIPLPNAIPSQWQKGLNDNYLALNKIFGIEHIPFGNTIEQASLSNPMECFSTKHDLITGEEIILYGMQGETSLNQIGFWPINELFYIATVLDEDRFSVDANTTDLPPYLKNSGNFFVPTKNYGFHKKTTLNLPETRDPINKFPRSGYFSKLQKNIPELFYKNVDEDKFPQITNLTFTQTENGRGFLTPWGIIINIGEVRADSTKEFTYPLPLPFSNTAISIIVTKTKKKRARLTANPTAIVRKNDFSVSSFTSQSVSFPMTVDYIAIGI